MCELQANLENYGVLHPEKKERKILKKKCPSSDSDIDDTKDEDKRKQNTTRTLKKNSNPLDDNDTSTECSAMITDTKSLSVLKNNSENKKVEQKSYASLIQGAT
ncbi:uncharacterized protein LOC105205336 isoform X2 [Solenopsis invicta]|uniref:uncharacterized protein LOC105205336 isoform X2 n=1 Tax=Solenopsis invicta TaxID=13686 RepID=UPI00193EBFD4|nr:uncharacterized protein LOC105205336 isoform X2 [Solenopsis invicta]